MKNKTAMCTICSYNYLPFGANACKSVGENNLDIDTFLLIVDEKKDEIKLLHENNIDYKYVDDIGIDEQLLFDMKFKYNVIEFNTAVKPSFLLYLFSLGYEKVIYMDPDTMCFHHLGYLTEELDSFDAILSPHRLTIYDSKVLNDSVFLNNGVYNLGFFAVRNTQNGRDILRWWEGKLENGAFLNYEVGLATDQLWCNLLPVYFQNVLVSRHPGLNVAYWNLEEREIIEKDNTGYIGEYPLLFMHFSGYSPKKPEYINPKLNIKIQRFPSVDPYITAYKKNIETNEYSSYSNLPYSYSYFNNGQKISEDHRKIYEYLKDKNYFLGNPFDSSKPKSFFALIKKLGVLEKYSAKVDNNLVSMNVSSTLQYKKFNMIFKLIGFRNLLRIVNICKRFSLLSMFKGYFLK